MVLTNAAEFDAVYWANKSPEIRAAFDPSKRPFTKPLMPRERIGNVYRLLGSKDANGDPNVIDAEIYGQGWGPLEAMQIRQMFHYAWITGDKEPEPALPPSFGGPEREIPESGLPSHGIKVSLDSDDYPAWVKR